MQEFLAQVVRLSLLPFTLLAYVADAQDDFYVDTDPLLPDDLSWSP